MSKDVFTTSDEHHQFLRQELAYPLERVSIASYGVGLGLRKVGKLLLPCHATECLNQLYHRHIETRVLVGVPPKSHDVLLDVAQSFAPFKWRWLNNSHLKCWVLERKRSIVALVGGRNLGCSTFWDLSLVLRGSAAREVLDLFDAAWACGKETLL